MKENQNIEWKEFWRDEYIKWICGFANAVGDILVKGSALYAFLLEKHGLHWEAFALFAEKAGRNAGRNAGRKNQKLLLSFNIY